MHQNEKKRLSAQKLPLFAVLLIAMLVACKAQDESDPTVAEVPVESGCGEIGALNATLFGSIETDLHWTADEMECASMQRPDGEGVRLRFAGKVSGETLAIIIAMPDLNPDETGIEVPSNVTATVEGSGRFFSTPNLDACWTEVSAQSRLDGREHARALTGTLFCVTPLGEINGDAAVSIPKLSFSTIADWSAK